MDRVAGLDEETVEDVRLAVGEACGRAVADRVERTSAAGTTITLHWRAGC